MHKLTFQVKISVYNEKFFYMDAYMDVTVRENK